MMEGAIALIFGIALGFVLERSQFCMASAFRDYFLFKHTSMLKAVLLTLAVTSAGFYLVSHQDLIATYPYLKEAGLYTAIGSIIFGVGMVLAGGCASSTLYRVGEGYTTSLVALVGMLVGIGGFAEVYSLLKPLIERYNWGSFTVQGLLGWGDIYGHLVLIIVLFLIYQLLAMKYSK